MDSDSPQEAMEVVPTMLQAALEASPDPIVVVDPEGRVLVWSHRAEEVFGWTAAEAVGEVAPMVHPDDREIFQRRVRDTLRGDSLRGRRTRKVRRDGEEVPALVSHVPFGDADDPAGVLFFFRPFLEEEVVERQLLESERRFRDLFDQAADSLILHTPDGSRILEVNREACESLGYSRSELLALSVPDVVKNAGPKERTSRVRDLPIGERIQEISSHHRRKDGTEFPAEVQLAALEWKGRRAILASCRDVSERRRIERSLLETNARLEALLEAAPVAVMVADRENRLVLWNPAAEEIFGWSADEVLGGPNPYVPEEEREDYEAKMEELLKGHQLRGLEVRRQRKDGRPAIVRIWTAPLRSAGGGIMGTMAMAEDVTERRKLEEQLRNTSRLRAVGQLAGGVAHDFNNHLTTILSLIDLVLLDLAEDHPARADIETVRDQARRSASLTQQLLAYGRQQALQPRVVDLAEVIVEAEPMLRRLLPDDVELRMEIGADVGPVRVDPTQVQQVLTNLLTNAGDAMREAGTVTLALRRPDDPERRRHLVEIDVVDEGKGMEPGVEDRIFEPFFTTKAGGGTGLGLATVFGIVEQSGGRIEVETAPGEGSTFRVFLPRATADES